jgi:cytochrome c oxidase cbb3-type subunit 3
MHKPSDQPESTETPIRDHVYDGIQEYDNRLPNWWLYTLYASIVFAIVFWFAHMTAKVIPTDAAQVDAKMTKIAALKMANSIDVTDDDKFWEMAANPVFVEAGKQTYNSLCTPCHLPSLRGKSENPAAVGPDLVDTVWVHGGTPKEIYTVVSAGALVKGMPAWEPVLGQKKTVEVVAYLLSHHQKGAPFTVEAGN